MSVLFTKSRVVSQNGLPQALDSLGSGELRMFEGLMPLCKLLSKEGGTGRLQSRADGQSPVAAATAQTAAQLKSKHIELSAIKLESLARNMPTLSRLSHLS